jgi:hypothetical protein
MTEMGDIDHTHPHTNEPFGEMHNRGAVVAADGGAADADADGGAERMEDVHHEPPAEGANRAFERGTEGRTETR